MSESSTANPDSRRDWPPTFRGGVWSAITLVLAFSLWVIVSNCLITAFLGPETGVLPEQLFGIASTTVQIGIVVMILRYEGVQLHNLGLRPRLLAPALAAIGGLVIALNALVAGFAVLAGDSISVEFFALQRSPPYDYSLTAVVAGGVHYYLFVGPAEELAFRGYLQNKVISLLEVGSHRLRTMLGVMTAATIFALLHVPTILILGGVQIQEAVGTLVILLLSGITFGAVYALTRNLYLVALLHGIGDWWPLFIEAESIAWPNWGVIIACYTLVVLLYRQWAIRTPKSNLGVPE